MSDPSPSSKRSNAKPHRAAVLFAALAVSFIEAVSLGIGIGRDVWGTGGSSLILPFVAAPVFAILLGVGWHIVTRMAVDAETWLDRCFTVGAGGLLSAFGITLSGAYLLALIAGNSAIQQHETAYLGKAKAAYNIAAGNVATESGIIGPVKAAHENLNALAEREANGKAITPFKGRDKVYGELYDSGRMFGNVLNLLTGKGTARQESLIAALTDLQTAETASAAFDHAGFQDAMVSFAVRLNEADSNQSAPSLAGIAAGLLSGEARHIVDDAIHMVRDAVQGIAQKRMAIKLEPYRPLDALHAVLTYPQPVQIGICLSLELICWLLVCLLLTLPRDPEDETKSAQLQQAAKKFVPQAAE